MSMIRPASNVCKSAMNMPDSNPVSRLSALIAPKTSTRPSSSSRISLACT
jgi:hypothetical protein